VTLGDRHLAADAVDEAFARAAERWAVVSRMDRPSGWVYRVAVNWATSWRRKWSRRPTLPAAALDRPAHDDLESVTLADGLAGLPLIQRQMLVLRFVLGYSVPETAVALDVAEGTVKSGVHRARQQLRADVEVLDGTR
jgi:RNA polymerase sigma factor (sigma-70 family)